jgi:hypothetical protein
MATQIKRWGIVDTLPITPDAANGNKVRFHPTMWVEVNNSSGSPITVTIHVTRVMDGQAATDRTVTINAGARKKIGPFAADYLQIDRYVWLTFSAVTSVTIGAFRAYSYRYGLDQLDYDWYVDSISGSDSNSGDSAFYPFATIAKLLTVLQAGESVGLAKGSHWREQLDLPGNGCTVEAYGSGALPILDASDLISAGSWAKTAGRTNVYEVNITPLWGVSNWLNVWEDDSFLTRAADLATCDSTPGSCFPSAATGTITLYIHATDSSDPGASGKVYEYSHRLYGLYSYDYSGCKITGIETRKNLSANGSLMTGRTSTIVNCLCSSGSKHNLLYRDGSFLAGVIAQNAYYGLTSHTYFVANENTPASLGLLHINCQAISDAYDSLGSGFYGHANTSGDFGAVQYIGCSYSNLIVGFEFVNATSVLLDGSDFTMPVSASAVGLRTASAVEHTLRNCNITHNGGRIVGNNIAGATITIDGGLWTLDAITNGGMVYGTLAYALDVQDLVLAGGAYGSILFYASHASTTFYARNNNYNVNITRCYDIAEADNLDSDYNNFYDDSTRNRVEGTDYLTITTYQAGTGQDAHSTVGA